MDFWGFVSNNVILLIILFFVLISGVIAIIEALKDGKKD